MTVTFIRGINPEPWAASEGQIVRGGGKMFVQMHKPKTLEVYQEAIGEALRGQVTTMIEAPGRVELFFWFWRRLEQYENAAGRKITRHRADATNCQKALEDALQKIFFTNDSQVVHVGSWMMEQAVDVEPLIVIECKPAPPPPDLTIRAKLTDADLLVDLRSALPSTALDLTVEEVF